MRIVGQNIGKKNVISSILGPLGKVESDYQKVWTCTYTIITIAPFDIYLTRWSAGVRKQKHCDKFIVPEGLCFQVPSPN